MPSKYRAGYKDGSGPEYITIGGKAIAITRWGCSCCQPTMTAEHKRIAKRIALALNMLAEHEAAVKRCKRAAAKASMPYTEQGVQQTPWDWVV